jgi:hypothetical protein
MTRACAELVNYLFGEHLLHGVEVRCAAHNYRGNNRSAVRRSAPQISVSPQESQQAINLRPTIGGTQIHMVSNGCVGVAR